MGELLLLIVFAIVAVLILNALVFTSIGLVGIIFSVLIWMLVGFIAGKILRGKGYGLLGNAALGVAGGFFGSILFRLVGLSSFGLIGQIVTGVIGAIVLIYLTRLIFNSNFAR